jgi:hypothetical protein
MSPTPADHDAARLAAHDALLRDRLQRAAARSARRQSETAGDEPAASVTGERDERTHVSVNG